MKKIRFSSAVILGLIVCAALLLPGSVVQVPSGTWVATGSLGQARDGAAAVLLADGRVLVIGGEAGGQPLASAESYSANGTFSPAPSMHLARRGHSATLLADGRVLVAGGETLGEGATNSVEIYDPLGDSWSFAGSMLEARAGHSATLLADGRVLIAGGGRATLEVFDSATDSFGYVGSLSSARTGHAAALAGDGRVLIVGGSNGEAVLASSEIFDPESGTVSAGPALAAPRVGHSATALLDGRVLVAGGSNGAADLASAEVYDPAEGSWSTSASLAAPRRAHSAFLLPYNNNVLIVGGSSDSAELYTPWTGSFSATGSPAAAHNGAAGSALAVDGLLLVAGGSGSASAELYGFATLKTDKDDYAPGEIVTITGSGWQPGETVSLLLDEVPKTHEERALTAVADENGDIFNNEFAPEEHDSDVRFFLVASGRSSQAQITFTDHGPSPVTTSNYSIAANASHNITVSVQLGGGSATVTLTAATAKIENQTDGGTTNVSLTSPGGNGNGTWSGSFQGACGKTYKINNVSVTWRTTHDHDSTETPGGTVSVTTGACPPSNTAPTLNLPANITTEATSAAGAVVNYVATATDTEDDPDPTPVCSPASGSTFALGQTTVNCSVTDSGGLSANGSFNVTVVDTTPPSLSLPADITAEATGPSGAAVSYSASATDIVDGSVPVSCSPASGSTFPLGTTQVDCSASDVAGNTANGSFSVTVVDTTPPTVSCGSPDSVWHANDVSISCTASDIVGLANLADASFSLSTSVASGTETDTAFTNSHNVCDTSGNCTLAGPIGPNKVDKKAPQQSVCDTADGAWHNANVTLQCTYSDGGSGPASQQVSLSTSVPAGSETANASASAGGTQACDNVGNCAASPADIAGNKIDRKAPQLVSCDSPDGLWHANNVTLQCTYSDGGSGPANQQVSLSTSVPAGSETANASASAGGTQACDNVGNCAASPADITGNKIDRKAPTINLVTPASGGSYLLNQLVAANYSCSDGGSGVASCVGTVANGSNIDTASVGLKSFTVNAADNVGNGSTLTHYYSVQYAPAGTMCLGAPGHQILQPINADGTSVFKKGSTVPAKFRVCDANGNSIGTPGVVSSFKLIQIIAGIVTTTIDEEVGSTTPDTAFRWSSTDQQWIFNISTKSYLTNRTYVFLITLNDGSSIQFQFGMK